MATESEKQLALIRLIKQAEAEDKPEVRRKALELFEKNKSQFFKTDVHRVPGKKEVIDTVSPTAIVKDVTEKIDTKTVQKIGNAAKAAKRNASKIAAKKALRAAGKKLPGILGFLAAVPALLKPTEAEAAVGDMFGAESMGGDPAIEDPTSPEYKARQRMLKLKHRKKR